MASRRADEVEQGRQGQEDQAQLLLALRRPLKVDAHAVAGL